MPLIIKGRVEDFGLLRDLERAPAAAKKEARKAVRKASLATEKRVKQRMPVDTGRARSSWGHWTANLMQKPNPDAKAGDAVWEVKDGGLTIVQGTNVEYVSKLNEGSSTQAPAGFIDTSANAGQRELMKLLAKILEVFR